MKKGLSKLAFAGAFLFALNFISFGLFSIPFWFFYPIHVVMGTVFKISIFATVIGLSFFCLVQ